MVAMKHTRTYDKIRTTERVLQEVRDWARGKDISFEDASVIKIIGSKALIEELEGRLKPLQEAAPEAKEQEKAG